MMMKFLEFLKESENNTTKLIFVGDIILDNKLPDINLSNLSVILGKANHVIGNLEIKNNENLPNFVDTLKTNKVNILSIANNHALDNNIDGLQYNLDIIQKSGIQIIGSGRNIQGITIDENTFLSSIFTETINVSNMEDIININITEPTHLTNIAYIHYGPNFKRNKTLQKEFGYKLISMGYDCVVGHGLHKNEEITITPEGKLIAFGIGDFFTSKNSEGVILLANKTNNIFEKVVIYPIKTNIENDSAIIEVTDRIILNRGETWKP